VKKENLFEHRKLFSFSETKEILRNFQSALIFWFFCIKTKEHVLLKKEEQ